MNKWAKRVDKNQNIVVSKLRELGFTVALTYTIGKGFPDFVIGFMGVNYLVELKSNNGTLTSDELVFFDSWHGQIDMHYTLFEIVSGFLQYVCLLDGFDVSYRQQCLSNILKRINNDL